MRRRVKLFIGPGRFLRLEEYCKVVEYKDKVVEGDQINVVS